MNTLTLKTEQQIIRAIRSGLLQCEFAIKYLYKTCHPLILNMVTKNNGNREDAADIFQESIIVAYQNIKEGNFRKDSTIKTFIYSVAKNLWLKKLSEKKEFFFIPIEGFNEQFLEDCDPYDASEVTEQRILSAFRRMEPEQKSVLDDYYYHNFSHKDIAEKYNLSSTAAAKNKKSRALKKLRSILSVRKKVA